MNKGPVAAFLFAVFIVWVCLGIAPQANAFVYISLQGSVAENNGGLQRYDSQSGSGSLSFDLSHYVRLGYTYKQELQSATGFTGMNDGDCSDGTNLVHCTNYSSVTKQVANSVDLTLILYEGQVFTPFILGGGVSKSYTTVTTKGPVRTEIYSGAPKIPKPNGGAGLYIKLTREFSLKFSCTVSPGSILKDPSSGQVQAVLDRESDFGLQYQL